MSRHHSQNILPLLLLLVVFGIITLIPTDALAAATPANPPAPPAGGGGGILSGAWDLLVGVLWAFVSNVFGFLVWMTGGLLDVAISLFIVQFGQLFSSSGLGAAVNNLWMVVRDIFNLLFIFGLIYAGFNMIINSDEGGARKTIVNLIIAALLINFSLFITKTIIDFGNIAAIQVANVLYQSAGANGSISGAFLQAMGAATIWGPNGTMAAFQNTPSFIYVIGAMFLFIIASFAFAAGAVLIGIRFVMLNYYMVISPVMFLDRIVPKFSSYTKDFWKDLLSNVFFAPAFLLLLYFSLYILSSMGSFFSLQGAGQGSLMQALSSPNAPATALTTIMMFFMAAGFLIASVIIAKKMGAVGAGMAISVGNDLRKKTTGAITGYAGRNSLGKWAGKYDKALEGRGVTERSWRRSVASSVAKSKYGGSYTYKEAKDQDTKAAATKARTDTATKISQSVKNVTNPPAGTTVTPEQRIEMERAISGASNEQILKVLGGFKEETQEYRAFVANLSSGQYDALMKAKEEELNDKQKAKIAETRQGAILGTIIDRAREKARQDALALGATPEQAQARADGLDSNVALAQEISKASQAQIKVLGESTLTKAPASGGRPLAAALSFSQIDDIKKSSDFTETEKERIVSAHAKALQEDFDGAKQMGTIDSFLKKFKDADVAKLPAKILTDRDTAIHLTPGMLNELISALSPAQRQQIKGYLPQGHLLNWFASPRGQQF